MEAGYIIALILTGAFAGFMGGLLGLGGAFIMTPVQYFIYSHMGLPDELAVLTAFGTSLLAVLPAAVSGSIRHHHNQAVEWRAVIIMGTISSVVALGGATLAANLPITVLKIAFGIILLLAGIRMLMDKESRQTAEPVGNPWIWAAWAVPIGLVSGLFGVGGGVVMIPILVVALRFDVHKAIGSSLGVIVLTSLGGIVGYIVNGLGVEGRLDWSLGYVNLTSWFLLMLPSIITAQFGAATAHKVPRKPLMYLFMVLLLIMSLRMMGVFEWLGWSF